jgi:anti-sigma factor RsiW
MIDQFVTYDAAYLLGALSPADRSAYEAHLADCRHCRTAVSQLAGMPGLLAAITPEQARAVSEPAPEVPETLLPRLMAEVERMRFRRRMTTVAVGVVAAAVLAIALVVGVRASLGDDPDGNNGPPVAAQQMIALYKNVPIRATARLYDQDWGTRVVVTCVYKGGDEWPEELPYSMVVVDKSGRVQHISTWEAKAGAPIVVDGSTSLARSEIAAVQVRTSNNEPILTLRL